VEEIIQALVPKLNDEEKGVLKMEQLISYWVDEMEFSETLPVLNPNSVELFFQEIDKTATDCRLT